MEQIAAAGPQSPAYEAYVATVQERLASRGFRFQIGPYGTLIARKAAVEMTKLSNVNRVAILTYRQDFSPEDFRAYAGWCYTYALGIIEHPSLRGVTDSVFVYSVGVVDAVMPGLASLVQQAPPTHLGAKEAYVVRDLSNQRTHFMQSTPFWGWAVVKSDRKFIREVFG